MSAENVPTGSIDFILFYFIILVQVIM